jgi:hypothetical protein
MLNCWIEDGFTVIQDTTEGSLVVRNDNPHRNIFRDVWTLDPDEEFRTKSTELINTVLGRHTIHKKQAITLKEALDAAAKELNEDYADFDGKVDNNDCCTKCGKQLNLGDPMTCPHIPPAGGYSYHPVAGSLDVTHWDSLETPLSYAPMKKPRSKAKKRSLEIEQPKKRFIKLK